MAWTSADGHRGVKVMVQQIWGWGGDCMFVYFAVVPQQLGQHLDFVPFYFHQELRRIFILPFICFSHCSVSRMTGVRPLLLGGLLVFPGSYWPLFLSCLCYVGGTWWFWSKVRVRKWWRLKSVPI